MYDPEDEHEPIYNPITQNNESPTDEFVLDVGFPLDEVEPLYNSATMEFSEEE